MNARHTKDEDCTLDPTGTCTVCGVLHGTPCPACGGRGFHREGCPELVRLESLMDPRARVVILRPARFQIDAIEGRTFEGFTKGETWNGFACPYFTYEQAQDLLGAFVQAGDRDAQYDADGDAFMFGNIGEGPATPEDLERFGLIRVGALELYAIGAFGWCWTEAR